MCVEGQWRIYWSGQLQDIKVWLSTSIDSTMTGQPSPVTGCGVMSWVCSLTFLCGSTLVKVPLLQAGTIAIWSQMFKSDNKTPTKVLLHLVSCIPEAACHRGPTAVAGWAAACCAHPSDGPAPPPAPASFSRTPAAPWQQLYVFGVFRWISHLYMIRQLK